MIMFNEQERLFSDLSTVEGFSDTPGVNRLHTLYVHLLNLGHGKSHGTYQLIDMKLSI